jgi:hypothetical protein
MGGGLMQLVAYGAQDIYLTGNPQITFFKVVYRRHTNFSMESIQQTINGTGTTSTTATTNGTVTIARNGDLVYKVYVTSSTASIEDGDEIVHEVDLEIGGQRIDKHYKEWNEIWAELTTPDSKALAYKNMTGACAHGLNSTGTAGVNMVQIPLNFWFCRNPGLALPLIALQYHEVKLKFTWGSGAGAASVLQVWCDYVYLDTDERRRFAQVSHEYLIEQLQKQTESSATATSTKLNFNHPVKELIWTSPATNVYGNAKLILNGHDRFAAQEEEYFQLRQPMDYHTAVPGANIPLADRPQMLSTQIDHSVPAGAGTVLDGAGAGLAATLTADASGFAISDTTIGIGGADGVLALDFKVGDVLRVTVHLHDDVGTVTAAELCDAITTITAVTLTAGLGTADAVSTDTTNPRASAVITVSPSVQCITVASTTADCIPKIYTLARLQDPLSRCSQFVGKINCYSFALKPEEHQPSGTCNFSRIDTASLIFNTTNGAAFNIYAINYNVLRIMSGMGGLAYSN